VARDLAIFSNLARRLTVMAPNLLWIVSLTYIVIRRHRAALTRDNALGETSIGTLNNTHCSQPVSPLTQASPAPSHNIYIAAAFIAAAGHAAFRPTTTAPAPDHPTEPAPPMSFSRQQGIYYVVPGKRPDAKSW
jgi:hypothetical protein